MAMAWTGAIIAGVGLVGNIASSSKANREGKRQKGQLEEQGRLSKSGSYFAANQLDAAATQQEAVGQLNAAEEIRKSELLQSRALAVAGASGAGASDPDVTHVIGRFAQEGNLAAETQLYNGGESARAMRIGAKVQRWEGDQAAKGFNIQGQAMKGAVDAQRIQTVANIANTAVAWYGNAPKNANGSVNWNNASVDQQRADKVNDFLKPKK